MNEEKDPDELKYCVYHLQIHCRSIIESVDSIIEFRKNERLLPKTTAWPHLIKMGLTYIVNKVFMLIEEHDEHFAQLLTDFEFRSEIGKKLRQIKKSVPDYERFRHEIGAHTFRQKKGTSIYEQGWEHMMMNPYKIPQSLDELNNQRALVNDYLLSIYSQFNNIILAIMDDKFPYSRMIQKGNE